MSETYVKVEKNAKPAVATVSIWVLFIGHSQDYSQLKITKIDEIPKKSQTYWLHISHGQCECIFMSKEKNVHCTKSAFSMTPG